MRPLVLDVDEQEPPELDRYGFYDGQWVHTPQPVVLGWFGEAMRPRWPDGELRLVHTNTHRIEGRLILGGAWPMIETTLAHPKPKYDWSPRRFSGLPVIYTVRRREDIRPGPLTDRRVLTLEPRATGCTPDLTPLPIRLD